MAFSINNTFHTWNNTEFNIQFLDPGAMNLSYQGPFWGTKDPTCNSSAFITLAFEIGFGQTACDPIIGPTAGPAGGGPFSIEEFSSAFTLSYNPNSYVTNTYNLQQYSGTNNLVDLTYIQLSNSIYGLGEDLIVLDAFLSDYITNISLPGNTQSKKLEFNPINNYLYCVSNKIIYAVDPLINTVVMSVTFSNIIDDVKVNTSNGDVYVSFTDAPIVRIYNSSNVLNTTLSSATTNNGIHHQSTCLTSTIFKVIIHEIGLLISQESIITDDDSFCHNASDIFKSICSNAACFCLVSVCLCSSLRSALFKSSYTPSILLTITSLYPFLT
jgi:hypothetical protein